MESHRPTMLSSERVVRFDSYSSHQSRETLQLLAEVSHHLLTADDSQRYVKQVFEVLKPSLQLDFCFNYLAVDDQQFMRLDFFAGIPSEVGESIRYLKYGEAVCGCVALLQKKIIADDIAHSRDERTSLVRGFGAQVYACFPLLVQSRFIGTLSFGSRSKKEFTVEQLALMEAVASQVAAAMDRLRLIQSLRRQTEELAEANRRKDEFLAMLGHELRNPLAAIRNALHLQKVTNGDSPTCNQLNDMLDHQVHNLSRMVDGLLDVSRITRGTIQLRKEHCDFAAIVDHAVAAVKPALDARHQQLSVTLPDTSLLMNADATRLEQVLVNLLTNASKYSKSNGSIALIAECDNGELGVRVSDHGCGIEPELLPKIFDLFAQGQQRLDRPDGGLGIGLTLVKRIVELHDGRIDAHSEGAGRGCEFVMHLPLSSDQVDIPCGTRNNDVKAVKVLVVEDSVDVAQSLKMLLEFWKHEARIVNDGPTALVAYDTYQPDVVLMDIGLPGMSGYDVVRQMRRVSAKKRPFIIAVTGYGHDEARRESREAGFDYHMTKPVEPEKLQSMLASVPTLIKT